MNTGAIALAVALMIIMFGMGLSLVKENFIHVFRSPKAMGIGLLNQLVLLPLVAFLLAISLGLQSDIAIGLMLLAACPGGATSNLITHLANGDTELSISLTTVNSFITIFTIPFVVDFAIEYFSQGGQIITLDKGQTILQIFAIVVIPVSLGMWVRSSKPHFAAKMNKPVRVASAIVLFAVILALVLQKKEDLIPYMKQAGIGALLLNVLTMILGFLSAKLAGLNKAQSFTISVESGIQNGTMAIAIATGILLNTNFAIAPAVYSLIMFFTGGAIIALGNTKGSVK